MSGIDIAPQNAKKCPKCGSMNDPIAMVCEECGAQLIKHPKFETKSKEELWQLTDKYASRGGICALFGLQSIFWLLGLQWLLPSMPYLFLFGLLCIFVSNGFLAWFAWRGYIAHFYLRKRDEGFQKWTRVSAELYWQKQFKKITRNEVGFFHQKFLAIDPHFDDVFHIADSIARRKVIYGTLSVIFFGVIIPLKLVFGIGTAIGLAITIGIFPIYLIMADLGKDTEATGRIVTYGLQFKDEDLYRDFIVYKNGRATQKLQWCAISMILLILFFVAGMVV
jgi:hypothetical protein